MQHDPPLAKAAPPPDSLAEAQLASADAVELLLLMGILASLRSDPRAWRQEMLAGMNRILAASASAAFILRNVRGETPPSIATHFDAGFASSAQRQAFLREMNSAPFGDPLSRFVLRQFSAKDLPTFTCLRADAVGDAQWAADAHVLAHRRATGMDDCLLSIHRGAEPGIAYAFCAFRAVAARPSESAIRAGKKAPAARFGLREKVLADTLHRGLDWLYNVEESAYRLNQASALPPRLRQTLDFLLAGDTERQVAQKMALSVHTVHGYVKSLYTHFAVSSRRELMARWIQVSGRQEQE